MYKNIDFKSNGEKMIASVLDSIKIRYEHEAGVIINNRNYQRIWYPDFKLSDYSLYLEYFGMKQDPNYDYQSREKLTIYSQNGIDVIPIYPDNLQPNLDQYLLDEIYTSLDARLTGLERTVNNYRNKSVGYRSNSFQGYSRHRTRYH